MICLIDEILKNTSDDELFCLFGEFLNRLIEKTKDAGVFCVDEGEAIFLDTDKGQVIKDMKSRWIVHMKKKIQIV